MERPRTLKGLLNGLEGGKRPRLRALSGVGRGLLLVGGSCPMALNGVSVMARRGPPKRGLGVLVFLASWEAGVLCSCVAGCLESDLDSGGIDCLSSGPPPPGNGRPSSDGMVRSVRLGRRKKGSYGDVAHGYEFVSEQ